MLYLVVFDSDNQDCCEGCPRVSFDDLEKHLREIKGIGSAKAILIMDSIMQYVRGNEHEK